ncbi:MAG TPA: HAD-IIIA family hydrolase [Crocinitomicaceae bacterium]|nr:HAD-IIIA family hydrolase [Crocinitomicaceae bacterium]
MYLEQNIKGLCQKFGLSYQEFLSDFQIDNVKELSVFDLETITEEYQLDVQALLFKPLYDKTAFREQLQKIKLLVLDVDGVMTDGGAYMTMNGDQMKKFDTKDGRGIIEIQKKGVTVAIISSGFYDVGVSARAKMLGIENCYVGKRPKLEVLDEMCQKMNITRNEVAMIGDDINDLEMMRVIGFKACPSNAVPLVKNEVNIILQKKGGDGCVREFIDEYLMGFE